MMEQIVTTTSGRIRGHEKGGLMRFLGIPYAQPPVGDLRFARARPVQPWADVLDAAAYEPAAPQFSNGALVGREDNCLTLNIVRPLEGDKLPVFLWIHGGGYMTGSADDALYYGDSFAERDIVFVSIQYRLNVLGVYDFSAYPGCEGFESNRALSDMIEAIKWVHTNIGAFGGDAENVTIGGESAGGAAVVTLMAAPGVKGMFKQVIAESALCNCVMTPQTARRNTDLFLEGMGWTERDLPLLRDVDLQRLRPGIDKVNALHQYRNPGIFLPCPVIDDLLPMRPLDAIRAGSAEGVRLLIGTNLNEGTMFVHPEGTGFPNSWEMASEMLEKTGNADGYEAVRAYYEAGDPRYGTPFVHLATDYAFEMPSVKAALAQSRHGEAWMYRFEFCPENAKQNGMLVSHAFELPCVFAVKEHVFSRLFFDGESIEAQDAIIRDMHEPWVRFIRQGEPDPSDWPRFAPQTADVRIFDRRTRTERLPRREMLAVWGDMRFYED